MTLLANLILVGAWAVLAVQAAGRDRSWYGLIAAGSCVLAALALVVS